LSFLSRLRYKLPNLLRPPHNLAEYRDILEAARREGYSFYTLKGFLLAGSEAREPFLILRHDIDSHPAAALRFAEAEERFGIRASYFFRQRTWRPRVMSILHRRGHEVGYHTEELTAYAVRHHLKHKQEVLDALPQIRNEFSENLARLRLTVGFELDSVAAHGDFTYPVLGLGNRMVLKDGQLRRDMGILYEAYDEDLMARYRNHVSDKPVPQNYHPAPPLDYIGHREGFLLLTHPRWWVADPVGNLFSDLRENYRKLRW